VGEPACVMGDKVTATCAVHMIPNPASGAPQPAPPMPFSAPLLQNLSTTVTIAGKPAVVVGSSGVNTPPHVGLHAADPFMLPTAQMATVTSGSTSVLVEGKPLARTGSAATVCAGAAGQVVGTAASVLVGG
jgi:uncharacterized Zn-binding protein involved in type VI secretion